MVLENKTQSIDGFVQAAIEVGESLVRPQAILQLFPGYDFAGMGQQEGENLKELVLQLDPGAVPEQLARPAINIKDTETDMSRWGFHSVSQSIASVRPAACQCE